MNKLRLIYVEGASALLTLSTNEDDVGNVGAGDDFNIAFRLKSQTKGVPYTTNQNLRFGTSLENIGGQFIAA